MGDGNSVESLRHELNQRYTVEQQLRQARDEWRKAAQDTLKQRDKWHTEAQRAWSQKDELQRQIDKLAKFILEEILGEPSQDEGAADTAIRVMRRYKEALDKIRQTDTEVSILKVSSGRLARCVRTAKEALGG